MARITVKQLSEKVDALWVEIDKLKGEDEARTLEDGKVTVEEVMKTLAQTGEQLRHRIDQLEKLCNELIEKQEEYERRPWWKLPWKRSG